MKKIPIFIILTLFFISGCLFIVKNTSKDTAEDLCRNYVNDERIIKPSGMTNEEVYNKCMENYGYGKK